MGLIGIVHHTVKIITDPVNCDEHLTKAKWSVVKSIFDPIGVFDIIDVVEDTTSN